MAEECVLTMVMAVEGFPIIDEALARLDRSNASRVYSKRRKSKKEIILLIGKKIQN